MSTITTSIEKCRTETPELGTVLDWLAANNIDEIIPEQPTFVVDDRHIFYRAFQFRDGKRSYDPADIVDNYVDVMIEDRQVPLVVPLTDEVREAFRVLGEGDKPCAVSLVEENYMSRLARDQRLTASGSDKR